MDLIVNQTSRKRILTRNDLVHELEQVLGDLRERQQFAGLRSYAIDSFFPTDNPFLRQLTLGDLATNAAEVLRDSSKVERKEVAALVEALHLINVRSDYSLSLLYKSFSQIEQKAESVQKALDEIMARLPRAGRVTPDDANVASLRNALRKLRKSEHFEKVKGKTIEAFWDQRAPSCSNLSAMTWEQLVETSPTAIFDLPNFGKSRFAQLLASIQRATSNAEQANSNSKKSNLSLTGQQNLNQALDELKASQNTCLRNIGEALSRVSPQALLTIFLAQETQQRRIGQAFGLTESRISQLLQVAQKEICENLTAKEPTTVNSLESALSYPACSQKTLKRILGLDECPQRLNQVVSVIAVSLGAEAPQIKNKPLDNHWTKFRGNLDEELAKVLTEIPLDTASLSKRLIEVLPGCEPTDILHATPHNIFYLAAKDCWYTDQEQALIAILKESKEPLTAKEITSIFVTGPRQMRYLLQNSKNIQRMGKNNGRRYSVAT